jgi:hypothetical protein
MPMPGRRAIMWSPSYRVIRTIYPPVDLFEDVAEPALWDLLTSAEAKLNPRIRDAVGNLSLVPAHRRVAGPTASLAMAPFTHASTDRPSRFSDGSYGVWYCGDRWEVALAETAYHFERFMRATSEPAGEADYRELVCTIRGDLRDIAANPAYAGCHAPDSWAEGQRLGRMLHSDAEDGIHYRSVRWPTGLAAALSWPDRIVLPITQARQFRYHWDGARMTRYFVHGPGRVWQDWPLAA